MGHGSTQFNLWNGPVTTANEQFGISYNGPLNTARTLRDLDIFRLAGIKWLRFPLQGWLPQGEAHPAGAELYNTFIEEASNRGFNLMANFLPKTTVVPSVNPLQTSRELNESLLAATTHYGFKVKYWELQRIKPDPAFPTMKGIGFPLLAAARQTLAKTDKSKSLHAVFTIDDPLQWNAVELFSQKLPATNDILGLRYDFIGLPENRQANRFPRSMGWRRCKRARNRYSSMPRRHG